MALLLGLLWLREERGGPRGAGAGPEGSAPAGVADEQRREVPGLLPGVPGGGAASEPVRDLDRAARRGPVRVQVVSLHGEPLPHARLLVQVGSGERAVHRTAADGTLQLLDVPYDGSTTLQPLDLGPEAQPAPVGACGVFGPLCTLCVPTGWPLRVRPVDALTGEVVEDVRWRLHLDEDPEHPVVAAETGAASVFARPGGSCLAALEVLPPSGYVAWDVPVFEHPVARDSRSLLIVYPLRREVSVFVGLDGVAAPDLRVPRMSRVRVGDVESPLTAVRRWRSGVQVGGVPFFRKTAFGIRLTGSLRPSAGGQRARAVGESTGVLPTDYAAEVVGAGLRGSIAGSLDPQGTAEIRRAGVTRVWRDRDRAREAREAALVPSGAARGAQQATGVLRVLRRDGRPVSGARLWVQGAHRRADDHGRLGFRLGAGSTRWRLIEPGLVPVVLDADLRPGPGNDLVLQEPQGGGLGVVVADEDGLPLPFARVQVRSLLGDQPPVRWADPAGTVQRLDEFADHRGRFEVGALDPGRVAITGSWADRAARTAGTVVAGRIAEEQLRMPSRVRRPAPPK